jgi:sigma-E factor negative regulatory protein RseA
VKDSISALMDGELARGESAAPLQALGTEGEARETWRQYHLIGDAMRETRGLSPGFNARLMARLAKEPTVLAPRRSAVLLQPSRWKMMPMAASAAAVALVAGGFYSLQGQSPVPLAKAPGAPASAPLEVQQVQVAPPAGANDYLLAHQGYSPRNSLQGAAPYVRIVSESRTAASKR